VTKKEKDNYGYSKSTLLKQKDFEEIMGTHINISKAIIKKHNWVYPYYWYFDLNAGPGVHKDAEYGFKIGSPLIFLNEAIEKRLPLNAILFENDKKNHASLLNSISKLVTTNKQLSRMNITTHSFSNEKLIEKYDKEVTRESYGLIYHDPKGRPNFDLFTRFYENGHHPYIDLMINCPCTTIKRSTYYNSKIDENRLLNDFLNGINKKYWLIREPYGPFQWSLIIGSNWYHFPRFKELGFLDKNSPEGQKLFKRLIFKPTDKRQTDNRRY